MTVFSKRLLGCAQGIQRPLMTGSQTGSFSQPFTTASQGEKQATSSLQSITSCQPASSQQVVLDKLDIIG